MVAPSCQRSRCQSFIFSCVGENKYKERLTRQSLEFPGEAVHRGLSSSSFSLLSEPARHEISANKKVGDPASTWPIFLLTAQLSSSASKCHIHFHKTPSILSIITMKFLQVAPLAFLAIASVEALATPNPGICLYLFLLITSFLTLT